MVRALAGIGRTDAAQCGNKAASLGELSARGYAVPACLVLPIPVYQRFLTTSGLTAFAAELARESTNATPARLLEIEREIAVAFEAAGLDPAVTSELRAWTTGRSVRTCAVRSSATNEDLPGASFAGQYSSFLNVKPAEVPRAVVRCFASLFTARAALYRRRKHLAAQGAMAVIVQEMVASDHAGVVFTQAPRRSGALLVECAPGLGEDVVSGTVPPNRYYFNRSTLQVEDSCERHPMDLGAVRAVAQQALSIEADFGGPQDVEFAVARGAVYILQARPASV